MDFNFEQIYREATNEYLAEHDLPLLPEAPIEKYEPEIVPCHYCGEDAYDGEVMEVAKGECADVCQDCADGYDAHSDDEYNDPRHGQGDK